MNKQIVLWIVFLMSLLMLWDRWQIFNGKASMFSSAPAATAQHGNTPGNSGNTAPGSAGLPSANANEAIPASTGAAPVAGEIITITTDLFKAEIDTVGGELRHLELLKQKEDLDTSFGSGWKAMFGSKSNINEAPNVVLFDKSEKRTYLAQTGLMDVSGHLALPNHKTIFVAQPGARSLDGSGEIKLVLVAEQSGVKLVKTYTFKKGSYSIDLTHQVVNESATTVTPSLYLQLVRDNGKLEGESRFYSTYTGPAIYTDEDKFQKLPFDKIEKGTDGHATKADNGWFAMVQHYFVSGVVPLGKVQREIFARHLDNNLYAVGNIIGLSPLAPGASESMSAEIYSGPLVTSSLEKVAPGFDLTKDYGWLSIFAKPVFWLMDEIHNVLGNWGWTIVVLTLIIKIVFFPLSAASFKSIGKMKLLSPKMTAIREQYKEDPQKMNQAMMELYKTEKVNPLGGCLPILIQTPVFMALYSVVLASVELRNAPWLGWVHDLSAPDPFLILPVVLAVTMFVQNSFSPAPPDPIQAKMMKLMPAIFSVMFLFFPAGLVLYWVVNNSLSIVQQWLITKKLAVK